MGNAWFYGSDGCFVITNFHVAFGQTKKSVRIEPTGKVINRVVLVDNPRSGHEVRFGYDFNAATGDFVRAAIGTVVAFGIYEEGSIAGMREDVAVLRLEKCAGKEFAGLEMDRSEENQKNPLGKLTIVGWMRSEAGGTYIGARTGCRSTVDTPGAGLVATSCEIVDGMSGSMLISENTLQIVGLNVSSFSFNDGTKAGISISKKFLNRFLDEYFEKARK